MIRFFCYFRKDQAMSFDEIEALIKFTWPRNLDHPTSLAEISEEMRQNHVLAHMAPNFISTLKTYLVLLSYACEAERSFSYTAQLENILALCPNPAMLE